MPLQRYQMTIGRHNLIEQGSFVGKSKIAFQTRIWRIAKMNSEDKPERETFDEFVRRLYTGQREIPFNLDYSIPASNYQLPYTRRNDPVIHTHINCRCDITPPLSIEDRLQRELAFDEGLLILKKISGYDVKLN